MRRIVFSPIALQQLDDWKLNNAKVSNRIVMLITAIAETPFSGIGKPEPLKHSLKGKWSRRITQEHRLVYEVTDSEIRILSCRYHYD